VDDLVLKYESAAADWVDELGVPLTERISMFEEILFGYAKSARVEFFAEDLSLAKFLYCNFLFPDTLLPFAGEIERIKKPYQMSFGRLELIKKFHTISTPDAIFIAQGIESNPILRLSAVALLTEFTRKSRLARAMELSKPVNLGSFNLLLAALSMSKAELRLHEIWTGRTLKTESANRLTTCAMPLCQDPASWLVICPHGDGREYMCSEHKRAQDLDFSTYRLMFTNSCGHYAERRDCTFIMVGI
jgi:hypothetical protein